MYTKSSTPISFFLLLGVDACIYWHHLGIRREFIGFSGLNKKHNVDPKDSGKVARDPNYPCFILSCLSQMCHDSLLTGLCNHH